MANPLAVERARAANSDEAKFLAHLDAELVTFFKCAERVHGHCCFLTAQRMLGLRDGLDLAEAVTSSDFHAALGKARNHRDPSTWLLAAARTRP